MSSPGKLDQRIIIRTHTSVVDGMGGEVQTDATLATVWAFVKSKSGKEESDYERVNSLSNYTFIIRYRSDITASMRIVWNSVEYNIRSIIDNGGRKMYLEIEAERGVPQ